MQQFQQANVNMEMPTLQKQAAAHHDEQGMLAMAEAQQWLAAHQQHNSVDDMMVKFGDFKKIKMNVKKTLMEFGSAFWQTIGGPVLLWVKN